MPNQDDATRLRAALNDLTADSVVTVDRSEGDVLVDGKAITRFLDKPIGGLRLPMEEFADTLENHVEELKFERACADGSLAKALREQHG